MILLIILTLFALLVLAFGFLGIKIPFVSGKKETKSKARSNSRQPMNVTDKLVKDSIEHTIRTTKFLKERFHEKAASVHDEY